MTSGPGYIVAEVTVHDAETYDQYVERSGPVLEKYGARLLAHAFPAAGELIVKEGGRTFERLVIVQFESLDRVTEFYHSPDYQAVIGLRHDAAESHVYHLAGVDS
ncbi:DUF1330 domain-containing protein [Aeromicrobium sp. CFBP 8757]|uniref:DUF1330 domain-containing protein n=1 Tax=Aeromicrobium sp. CFBP 8757 TaxID=2775288 RepID=UPI00177AC66D|nr:DUF1330 domain-containing protein [Aeromicrobium sp. CFBP 8757]